MEKGSARKIYKHLVDNYDEFMREIGLEVKIADSPMEELEVSKYPSSFITFMENKGYCNREIYNTYSASDVLSYVTIASNRLFEYHNNNFEINNLIGKTISLYNRYGNDISSKIKGELLYNEIASEIENMPFIVNFKFVREVSTEFLLEFIGRIYKDFPKELVDKNLICIEIQHDKIHEKINTIKSTICKMQEPEVKKVLDRFYK